jgi:LCP family protein required for cell wall assembly
MGKGNKKNLPVLIKFIIGLIVILVISVSAILIFINVELNKINHLEETPKISPENEYFEIIPPDEEYLGVVSSNDEGMTADTSEIYDSTAGNAIESPKTEISKDNNIVNILLVGQDRRPGEGRARSDTMMIATINKKNNTVKLTSIMRDLYVKIPGYSDNRINAAYAFGGMKLLDETIEKNFNIHIDGNIEVDFDRFIQVIDKVGKIDIFINKQEAAYLSVQGFTGLSEGVVQMDGALALAYCRIRYIGNSDYERTDRQKRVIKSEFNNVKDLGLDKILKLVDEVFPLVRTDMSNGKMINLASSVALMGINDIESCRIPVNNAYTAKRIKGMAVLVPDLFKNQAALQDFIFN